MIFRLLAFLVQRGVDTVPNTCNHTSSWLCPPLNRSSTLSLSCQRWGKFASGAQKECDKLQAWAVTSYLCSTLRRYCIFPMLPAYADGHAEYERKSETIHICNKLFLLCFAFNFSSAYDPLCFCLILSYFLCNRKKKEASFALGSYSILIHMRSVTSQKKTRQFHGRNPTKKKEDISPTWGLNNC